MAGPRSTEPRRIGPDLLADLEALAPLAPLHQPHNLAGASAPRPRFPGGRAGRLLRHRLPPRPPLGQRHLRAARRFYDAGVRRYGFHGLSYEYIAGRLAVDFNDVAQGNVIVAHLGNGASLCAMRAGRSVGSTMGFSALDGMPMGTRCGQLDPGVILHLLAEGMDAASITRLLYTESGLKGLSGISHDMRRLLASDAREAAEAVDYYVYRLAREIGAMAAVLGGIDALVFTGGIGENSPAIRARALGTLGFLGLALDPAANEGNAARIGAGPVPVLVIPTDEERVIARATVAALA
jgi:acetate kinase